MLDRRMELLRVLDRVGTITGAAELLYRSPSGYSRQLSSLADELGVQLLEQHGREVRLTAAARRLVSYADEVKTSWLRTRASLTEESDGGGRLRIGAIPTSLSRLVVPLLGDLSAAHPLLSIRLSEVDAPRCFDQLIADQLDACLVPARAGVPPQSDRRFHQRSVIVEPIDALVPPEHPAARRPGILLKTLAEDRWVLPGDERSGHEEILSACHAAGFTPQVQHYAQDTQAVSDLVAATGAVSLTSRFATYRSLAVRVPLTGSPQPGRQLLLCTAAGAENTAALGTLVDLIRLRTPVTDLGED